MNARHSLKYLVVVVASLLCIASLQAGKPNKPEGGGGGGTGTAYVVVQLETTDGVGLHDRANDVNDLREVVGQATLPSGDTTAGYWTVTETGGGIQSTLSLLDGGHIATAVNNLSEIVGVSYDELGNTVAVYWPSPSSPLSELKELPSPNHDVSVAQSINNYGLICGYVADNLPLRDENGDFVLDENGEIVPDPGTVDLQTTRAVVWRVATPGGARVISGPVELPADGDGFGSGAHALNDKDDSGVAQVVGYQRSEVAGEGGPFLWKVQSHDDGTVSVSSVVSLGDGNPSAINNSGLICGRLVGRSPSDVDALVWSGDTASFLDRGKGRNNVAGARARDIGDTGIIVGEAGDNLLLDSRACFWAGIDGSVTYLDAYLEADSPLVGLDRANAVNTFDDIVGDGWYGAFIAIPASP